MELTKLEKYKSQFSAFYQQIEGLQNYLSKVEESGYKMIYLDRVSTQLDIPAIDALFLMSLAEKEHLVKKKLLLFTKEGQYLIGEFNSASEIPSELVDENTGKKVHEGEYYVDIVFEAPNE